MTDLAPPREFAEAPESLLSNTSTAQDEAEISPYPLSASADPVDILQRIYVASLHIVEYNLRHTTNLSPKEKCDLALRAMQFVEGIHSDDPWFVRVSLRRPLRKSTEMLESERADTLARMKKVLVRYKELEVLEAEKVVEAVVVPENDENEPESVS